MTVRGTFDPTGFNPGDPDTFPPELTPTEVPR